MASFYKLLFLFIFVVNFFIAIVVYLLIHSWLLAIVIYIFLSILFIQVFSYLIYESFQNHRSIFFRVFPVIHKSIEELSQRIDKLSIHRSNLLKIIENIRLGVLLVNNKNEVLLSNRYIADLFGCNIEFGKSIVDGWENYKVISLFDKFLKEDFSKVEFEHKTLKFDKISLTDAYILLIEDVTKEESYQKMKMTFFSNASHELKTPITSIMGYAETLLINKDIDRDNYNKFLNYIYRNALSLNNLINNILELAQIEHYSSSNKLLSRTNLADLVVDLNINNLILNKPIKFIKEIDIDELPVNDYHMKTILNNLLDNACSYTKEGFIKLRCFCDDMYYVIEVEDTGIGIEKSQQEKIFERFYKVKSKGSGLGLAIVKHLVMLYNGTIEVESKVSLGSLFRIKFPKEE